MSLTDSDDEPLPSRNRRRTAASSTKETVVALSEEDQLLLAIQNSIRESQSDNVLSADDDVVEVFEAEQPSAAKRPRTTDSADTFTNYLGSKTGKSHNLNVFFILTTKFSIF